MNTISIERAGRENCYSIYENEVFIGKMDCTHMLLFYIAHNIRKSQYNDKVISIYASALSLQLNDMKLAQKILEDKFCAILDKDIDFSEIDLDFLLSHFDRKVNLNRIRSFAPRSIVLGITNRCFCQCYYCYAKENGKGNASCSACEMDLSTIDNILKYAFDSKVSSLVLTGGDPMAHSMFWKVLELCRKYQMKAEFSTKKILSDKDIGLLYEYRDAIKSFQISIDTIYENEEALLTNASRCNDAVLSLERVIKRCGGFFDITVNSVLTKYNIDNILNLTDRLISIGCRKHILSRYTFNLSTNNAELLPSREQYDDLSYRMERYAGKDFLDCPFPLSNGGKDPAPAVCSAGISGIIISCDGNTYVCERFCPASGFSLGNISAKSLAEIWNGPEIADYSHPRKIFYENSKCAACENFNECMGHGLCYVEAYILNGGNIYGPDYRCRYRNTQSSMRIY